MNIKTIPLSLLLIISSSAHGNKEFYISKLLKAQNQAKNAELALQAAQKEVWQTEEGKIHQHIKSEFYKNCRGNWNDWDGRCKELYLTKYESAQNVENTHYYNEHYRSCVADLTYKKSLEIALQLIVSVVTNDNYDDETKSKKIENIISPNKGLIQEVIKGQNQLNDKVHSLVKKAETQKH